MTQYANVIVDLSAGALDRLFSYRVPESMQIVPGQQVRIPFGPRKIEGFVVSLSDRCELDAERVKDILEPVQDYPVVLPELMELADWMHERYLCNLVDALRLMIPSEMRSGRVQVKMRRFAHLKWSEEQVAAYAQANPRAKRQIELLMQLQSGDMDTASLNAGALKALREKGAV